MDFNKYSKQELIKIMTAYDEYIQNFYEDLVDTDMCPVCIREFIDNEYQEMLDSGCSSYTEWLYNS